MGLVKKGHEQQECQENLENYELSHIKILLTKHAVLKVRIQ